MIAIETCWICNKGPLTLTTDGKGGTVRRCRLCWAEIQRLLRVADVNEPISLKTLAHALGRKGGLKGGRERARRLSPERRKEIAAKAAKARWAKAAD